MQWLEKNQETEEISPADMAREKVLNLEKETSLPAIRKEAEAGTLALPEPIKFQPVKSPGIYEAEFGVKGKDVIFHFWPFGYHIADASGKVPPRFPKDFLPKLTKIMNETFNVARVEIKDDRDMGALFVKALAWADSQFYRELCVKACQALHDAMGGEPG